MGYRARGALTSGPRGGSLIPERLTRAIVCCLPPEDGQGSGSARHSKTRRPLYGIRPKANKGLNRRSRVLQNPDHGFPGPQGRRPGRANPIVASESIPGNTRQRQAVRRMLEELRILRPDSGLHFLELFFGNLTGGVPALEDVQRSLGSAICPS